MLEFANTTPREDALIQMILERYRNVTRRLGLIPANHVDVMIDIIAVHQSIPLDLEALVNARENDFLHDMAGIRRYVNFETGEVDKSFVPRCAREARDAA